MNIQERRMAQGWTQEQLAEFSGVSTRTIQRIEKGNAATLESLKCLAAVFETEVSTLMNAQHKTQHESPNHAQNEQLEKEAIEYVQNLKAFHLNWLTFLIVVPCLFVLNILTSPDQLWIVLVIASWLAAIGLHAMIIFGLFNLFGASWEQRTFQKRMSRTKETSLRRDD